MNGISSSQFLSDSIYTQTFQQTVASTIVGTNADNVIVQSVTDTSGSRRKLISTTMGIEVNFTVALVTALYGMNPVAAYSAVTSQLVTNVQSGSFASQLIQNAAVNGATALQLVSVSAVAVANKATQSPSLAPTAKPTPITFYIPIIPKTNKPTVSSDSLTPGAIFGIALSSVIVFASTLYLALYFCIRHTLVVDGLPKGYSEAELLQTLPGSLSITRLPDGESAFVAFDTHAHAHTIMINEKWGSWHMGQNRLRLSWEKPFLVDFFLRVCCSCTNASREELKYVDEADDISEDFHREVHDLDDAYDHAHDMLKSQNNSHQNSPTVGNRELAILSPVAGKSRLGADNDSILIDLAHEYMEYPKIPVVSRSIYDDGFLDHYVNSDGAAEPRAGGGAGAVHSKAPIVPQQDSYEAPSTITSRGVLVPIIGQDEKGARLGHGYLPQVDHLAVQAAAGNPTTLGLVPRGTEDKRNERL